VGAASLFLVHTLPQQVAEGSEALFWLFVFCRNIRARTLFTRSLRIEKTDNPKHPERIALSIRSLEKDPWQDVLNQYPVGTLVQGTVSRIQPFGAFIELAPGVDGLVHISELGAGRRISHPQEVVSVGDQVQATVLSVDMEKHRIGLSLDMERKSEEGAGPDITAEYKQPKQSLGTLGDLLRESMKKQK